MDKLIVYSFLTGGLFYVYRLFKRSAYNRRRKYIDLYVFPESIKAKVLEAYPHLTATQTRDVMKGLKEYFHIANMADQQFVSMPSQVVDVAWHEFILFTVKYQNFCHKAFSRFLHHVPAEAMLAPTMAQEGIQRAWKLSCKRARIDSESPSQLPILFSLDSALKIPNGFIYKTDCRSSSGEGFCAAHIVHDSTDSTESSGCSSHGCSSSCGSSCD